MSPLGICGFGRTKLEHEGGLIVQWVAVFIDWCLVEFVTPHET